MGASKVTSLNKGRRQVGDNLRIKHEDQFCPKNLGQVLNGDTFENALTVLRKGGTARRGSWPDGGHIRLEDNRIRYYSPDDDPRIPEWIEWANWSTWDLLATDWEFLLPTQEDSTD